MTGTLRMKGLNIMNKFSIEPLYIETAFVTDITSHGSLKEIEYINKLSDTTGKDSLYNSLLLYTEGKEIPFLKEEESPLKSNTTTIVVMINEHLTVTQILCIEDEEIFNEDSFHTQIPKGCFAICSSSIDPSNENILFLKNHFNVGDIIRLRFREEAISINKLNDIRLLYEGSSDVILDGTDIYSTNENKTEISGVVYHIDDEESYEILITQFDSAGKEYHNDVIPLCQINSKCSFTKEISLTSGVNYIDISLKVNNTVSKPKSKVIYQNTHTDKTDQQVIMWIEQYVNARALDTVNKIESMVDLAKKEGITSFAIDVKGCGGYAAHKKTSLTNVPYMTESKNPKHQITMEIDFLEEFIKVAHAKNMKVYASINFFAEGMFNPYDSAIDIAKNHPDWAEVLYVPEDGGELKSVLETKRSTFILYVNPANDEVQAFQLKRAHEVLINYDVDGIIMDRTRYDNQYADFSEVTRHKFEVYLKERNKSLHQWPQDIYSYDENGIMQTGSLYYEWLTFRSSIIAGFASKLRTLIDTYNKENNKEVALAAYVGSWYESYYQNGVNWADSDFVYDKRLDFPLPDLYTKEYGATSYLGLIDFLMIGCYYKTKEQIEKYVALGMILTDHKVPLIGSISLPDLPTKELQRTGVEACYNNSNGCMIFDLCYVDWNKLSYAMELIS